MLTRGMELSDNPYWDTDWKKILEERTKGKAQGSNLSGTANRINGRGRGPVGWEQNVTLKAYVVNLKDIAKRNEGDDLLTLLLQKYESGAAPREIWEFPAVQATINYHWDHWARRLLLLVFALFLVWTLSFGAYLYFYIVENDDTLAD